MLDGDVMFIASLIFMWGYLVAKIQEKIRHRSTEKKAKEMLEEIKEENLVLIERMRKKGPRPEVPLEKEGEMR